MCCCRSTPEYGDGLEGGQTQSLNYIIPSRELLVNLVCVCVCVCVCACVHACACVGERVGGCVL